MSSYGAAVSSRTASRTMEPVFVRPYNWYIVQLLLSPDIRRSPAVTAARRGADDNGIADVANKLIAAFAPLDGVIGAVDVVLAAPARLAAGHAIGRYTAVTVQERDFHSFAKTDDAFDTV